MASNTTSLTVYNPHRVWQQFTDSNSSKLFREALEQDMAESGVDPERFKEQVEMVLTVKEWTVNELIDRVDSYEEFQQIHRAVAAEIVNEMDLEDALANSGTDAGGDDA